jgi:L-threonylcarbamoyladenylate synthase
MTRKETTLDQAVEALRAEELIVYPTETFYALGADSGSPAAIARLLAAKGREARKPIALIASDCAAAFALAREVPERARRLSEAFWPGPLTLVLPAKSGLPDALVADGGVGVRVSSHPVACELARRLGRPITATSANPAGQPPATTVAQARVAFGDKVKVYLEGGTPGASASSTVVTFDRGAMRVLRAGAISECHLIAALSTEARE